MQFPNGLDPYISRQHLLHHTYSPLITLQSSHNADTVIQSTLKNEGTSVLQLLKPYGNNAKYSIANQIFKITNTQLITKNYPSFPVRFEPTFPDLLSINSTTIGSTLAKQLFNINSLEMLLKHISLTTDEDLYLSLLNKIITSNKVVPFETFNHPVAQLFVIDYHSDSLEFLRKQIVDFRNQKLPKYFQIDDLLFHVIVLYDSSKVPNSEMLTFQKNIKATLNILSTIIPVNCEADSQDSMIKMPLNDNSTIEEDLQRISLNDSCDMLHVPKSFDSVLRSKLYDFIGRFLIPHMQSKIRIWDDQVLQPKRSIANKFFSASKKLFNNESNTTSSYNFQDNYYNKTSPEQIIRKLADWALILKDFKYAYSTYDLIKKDYTNDKSWAYVASTQEMCIISLLLAQTQQSNQVVSPDKNMLRKIRHDIIEPYYDNLSYTFKSRLDLKTYNIRTLLVIVELLLCMSTTFNIFWWWNDLIEKYLCKCINEFDSHLLASNDSLQVIRAILYERLGYSIGHCVIISNENRSILEVEDGKIPNEKEAIEEEELVIGFYFNQKKLDPVKRPDLAGLTRLRKSAIWYILSLKEWSILDNKKQIRQIMNNIRFSYNIAEITDEWYDRENLLLGFIKRKLNNVE